MNIASKTVLIKAPIETANARTAIIGIESSRRQIESANKLLTRDPGTIYIIQHTESVCD
jgi:hypothetical protein